VGFFSSLGSLAGISRPRSTREFRCLARFFSLLTKTRGLFPGFLSYVPLEVAKGAISFNPQPTARNLIKPHRTLRRCPSRSAIPAGQHDPFGAGPMAIARGLRPSGSRKRGDCPGFFVTDKRPKFTAKARSSPSLRTSQEAPGADQSILNRQNAGTVPEVCQQPREPTSASGWAI
jgi:hypothetical protein